MCLVDIIETVCVCGKSIVFIMRLSCDAKGLAGHDVCLVIADGQRVDKHFYAACASTLNNAKHNSLHAMLYMKNGVCCEEWCM